MSFFFMNSGSYEFSVRDAVFPISLLITKKLIVKKQEHKEYTFCG